MRRSWAVFAGLGWRPGSGPCRSRYPTPSHSNRIHARLLRPGIRAPVLADPGAGGSGPHPVPRAIPREGQPGAFLLGKLRHGGHPLLRTGRAQLTGNSPNLGAWVMQEAYSHEVSSCGFWPGNGGFGKAAFYSYAYPEPQGFASAPMSPTAPTTIRPSGNSFCPTTRSARRNRRMTT